MSIHIRDAVAADAAAICDVRRRSISELCAPDHHNDPAILARWLGNKTPEIVASWIAQPGNTFLVAVEDGVILGAASMTDQGHVTLNYVLPAARFRGVSRALLAALEERAMQQGHRRCTLESTETARRFYRSSGYREHDPAREKFGTTSGYPMSKDLGNN